MTSRRLSNGSGPGLRLAAIAPGILIAATGVGAGDLMTATLGGSVVGVGIVWAAVVGAALKWFLNEGIARWQMATGTTLLEGWSERLGAWIRWVFLVYFLIWTIVTAGALISACGVAGLAIVPVHRVEAFRWLAESVHGLLGVEGDVSDAAVSKIAWGVIHSLVGLVMVRLGGYGLFKRFMGVCIAVMFVTVMVTACLMLPTLADGTSPRATRLDSGETLHWILSLIGGVGGTVTLLSYGYWIREAGRSGARGLSECRLDLAIGYSMTALFGVAMVFIGSRVTISDDGASTALELSKRLEGVLGLAGSWVFRIGFWGAVFSSLLGVWQGVPYLFADFVALGTGMSADRRRALDYTKTRAYRGYLLGIAVIPLVLLWTSVKQIQTTYAVLGAFFMPLLALTLLIMNNRVAWVGAAYRSRRLTNVVLSATLLFFGIAGAMRIYDTLTSEARPPAAEPSEPGR